MEARRILIAASGTGGHLMPALYIAKALQDLAPNCEILFVGSGRPLEGQIIDKAGFKRQVLSTVGIKRRGIKGAFEFLFTLPWAALQCAKLFFSFKPQIIIGVGGYVTFLPIVFGWLSGKVTWIHEAELKPGLANSVLSFFARRVSTGFEQAQIPFPKKAIYTGQPLRAELVSLGSGSGPWGKPQKILVMGGSQGAQALDLGLIELTPLLKQQGLKVWHQCRAENVERLTQHYRTHGIDAQVMPFIDDTVAAFGWSDLVISRAGAGAVMEIGVVNRPAILVPYPFAQGNHQKANAMTLVGSGKALLVEEGEGFTESLKGAVAQLLELDTYQKMRSLPFSGRVTDAAYRIARGALELAGK